MLAVLTAGGHGLDVAAIAQACGRQVTFYDDDPTKGYPSLQDVRKLDARNEAVVGLNDPQERYRIASMFPLGHWSTGLIHPQVIGVPASIGVGSVISPGVIITVNVIIGDHVHVNVGATLSQTTTLCDFVTVSPGANICGEVTVGERSWIGVGAQIKDHITVGADCMIGAGAVVIHDVPDGQTVVGIPAKELVRS